MNRNPLMRFLAVIGLFFALLLGRLSWTAPPWFDSIHQKARARPSFFWGSIASLVILIAAIAYGYHWYTHLPRPTLITTQITSPQITPNGEVLVPDSLKIDFGVKEHDEFLAKSVASLDLINKDVSSYVTIKPEIPGNWTWQSDNRLIFTPSKDWVAGQVYTVHFDKKLIASNIKMEKMTYSFQTRPFQVKIDEFKYYQDPVNPQKREAVATVTFNYPVDSSQFEKKVDLVYQSPSEKHFKFTVTYDQHKRIAYLHSEPLPLPKTPSYLQLTIDKNVKPFPATTETKEAVKKTILIPDAGSYFKVNNATASIVRNEQDKPEQALLIETTLGIKDAELNKGLHVYLLPQDYPATSSEEAKTNYEWQNPGEVTDAILKLSSPLNLQAIPSDRDYPTLHSYKIAVNTPRYIYLKIDKGARSFGDFVLAQDYVAVIKVPDYPKEIGFLHKGALLALSGEKKISVTVRGLPAVKFEIARVLPDDVNQLVTQTEGDFNNPHFIHDSFNQQNISQIYSDIQQFDNSDLGKAQYRALDLNKYLSAKTNSSGPLGLFLLNATGWDVEKNTPLDVKNSRLILITDLGLLVKDNSDGTHDVFVQSITKGTPVSNVNVAILGKNGLPLLSQNTDSQGRAHLPVLDDFIDEREPTVYLAKSGGDVSFIPFNKMDRQLNYSRFDVGGVMNNDEQLKTLSAYLFSDRGLYRPGDEINIGMIVKRAYAQPEAQGLPVEVIVNDPRGIVVKDHKFTLTADGFSTLNFKTNATSPTGQYTVNLYIVRDNHVSSLLGSTNVRVGEFLPDRMRVITHFSKEQTKGWISPANLKADVNLQNLYGAPAADRKVTGKILLAPQRVQFAEFPNYIFVDPLLDSTKPTKVFTEVLSETRSNDLGSAQFDLNLDRYDKATYQLTFFAEGFEAEGGRGVSAQSTMLVSPLSYLVGYKPDGDLTYIKQNSQRNVNFVVINPELHQQAANNLRIQVLALHPVTSLVKKPDGTYQYESIVQTSEISMNPFPVSASGTQFPLVTDKIGDFAVKIFDEKNTELTQFKYSVVGASQVPLPKNAELSIKLNKTEYLPGEDIELQITSPYTGAGLITIERDNVYAIQWFKTDTTSSVQKIHIPNDFQGNGYVNVAFIRDWSSPDIFMSPLSYSIVPFAMNHDQRAIKIDLAIPDVARPGEPLTVNYKTDKPSKIIIFGVDEGILQVAKYKTPDPLGFFFQKRALQVITQQTVDQILPKFIQSRELSSVGGDGGEEEIVSNLNPFKRKTDLPVAFWSGIVDADTTTRQFTYSVPDYFNGSLHVMAVAVSLDAVGAADKTALVRGDFVINPNVPTFVAPGDEFEITSSIANNLKNVGANAKITVELKVSPQLEIIGENQQNLIIPEGKEGVVHYRLRAKSVLGSAQIVLIASNGGKEARMHSTLSVRPATPFQTTVNSGSSNESNKIIELDRSLYPEFRKVEAVASTTPLILVLGLQRYLDNFPFGCTEQLVSKAFPLLSLGNLPWFANDRQAVTDKIQATIQMLTQRQMSSGAISYWPDMGENVSNPFASVYAMHFLTEARNNGYDVPNDLFHAGIGYLKELASQNITSLEDARTKAYAIYILTRNEIVTTNYLTNLQLYLEKDPKHAWRTDITSTYMAATYQLLKSYPEANKFLNYFIPKIQNQGYEYDFYNDDIAAAQYLYLIARHFPDRLPEVGKKLVMPLVNTMNNNDINTIYASYTSLALSAYAQADQTTHSPNFLIKEILTNGQQQNLSASDNTYQKVNVDELAKQINFYNPDKQTYFYQLTQAGFDTKMTSDIVKEGLEVNREYRDAKGNIQTEVGLGNEIEVHIQLRSLSDRYLSNIAVVDLLPGGFEVVPDSVNHLSSMDYADIREDRVVFFGSVSSDAKEIVYRIKATNIGHFLTPPIYAASMYDPNIRAHGISGSMAVSK